MFRRETFTEPVQPFLGYLVTHLAAKLQLGERSAGTLGTTTP